MNSLALEIEKELPTLDPEAARHFEQAVKAMLLMAKRREPVPVTAISQNTKLNRVRHTLPKWDLGVRPGLDLTKLAHFEEDI